MVEPDTLVTEISAIDLRLAVVPDEDLVACGDLIEARRILVDTLGHSPAPATLTELRDIGASTDRLVRRLRLQRERFVAALGNNRRNQSLVRALSEPRASHSSYFG